ncbi:unnamed protein product [Prunus brigantina]
MELHQNTNWRADSSFKNGYLNKLETMLKVKLPNSGLKASPHIESRVKTLKGKYGALADALSQSGFGWNEEEMMLVCEKNDASVHQNRSVGDDFIEEMFSRLDGGSQYGGSEYGGSQFEDVEDLEDDETTFTQPNPQPSSAQQPIAGMSPQLAGLVNVLSTEKDLADMQAKLCGELRKIEFLSPLQVFRITNVLAKEHDLLRIFFTMTNEEKKDYVFNLMEHGLQ